MLRYKRIALTAKPQLTEKEAIMRQIVTCIRDCGGEIIVDRSTLGDADVLRSFEAFVFGDPADVLLVVGGDGTILRAVRELPDLSIPILSVNRGAVGFLSELQMEEIDVLLPVLLHGDGTIDERHIFHVAVQREGVIVFESLSLNEVAISQGAIARLLDVRTCVNDQILATFHADGLILSTPTGSTAYSLAAGGPVVHPRLDAMILTPINPHSLTQKPIVIPGSCTVCSEILEPSFSPVPPHVSLTIDGQTYFALHGGDFVTVATHTDCVRFVRRNEDTFYKTLRTKLRWG